MESHITLNECFLVVHDVLVGGLLKPIDGNISEVRIVNILKKLKLFLENVLVLH